MNHSVEVRGYRRPCGVARCSLSQVGLAAALVGLWPAPAECQQPTPQSSFQAESLAIAGRLDSIRVDSLRGRTTALARADSVLRQPVLFDPGSTDLVQQAGQLVNAKAWYLWFNPALKLRLSGRADSGLAGDDARAQARRRVDVVRKQFRDRGISLDRIAVDETDSDTPGLGGGRVDFSYAGRTEVVETPPPDADPPPLEVVSAAVAPSKLFRNRWATVRVFYATDRARSGDTATARLYGGDRASSGALEFGRLEVTVPRIHRRGVVEQPAWYRLERSPDPNRHLMVRLIEPADQRVILDSLRRAIASARSQDALLFIHGYNVTFEEAALRTAQLTYDLGFQGTSLLFSWPSQGSVFAYSADREAAEWSAQHLASFLDSVVGIAGAKRLHIIAHSMGNRALTLALEQMARPARDTTFSNVVLAAPDLDALRFDQQTAPRVLPLIRRLTIYMSRKDKALAISRRLSTHMRLGEATQPMLVVRGTDTIDASNLDTDLLGHGYIASSRQVIDDLSLLLAQHWPPRGSLRSASAQGKPYWELP